MNKKRKPIMKLLVFFIIVAILFGLYSIFFSEKVKNMGYYVSDSVELISYDDLKNHNVKDDNIDDLILSLSGKMSLDQIEKVSNKFNLGDVLSDAITHIKGENKKDYRLFVFDDLFINFEDDVTEKDIQDIQDKYGIKLTLESDYWKDEKIYVFDQPSGKVSSKDLVNMLKELTNESVIEYAQPSYLCSAYQLGKESGSSSAKGTYSNGVGIKRERPWKPNDPKYADQWNFKEIETELAWNKAKGDGVIVAVIDTGVSSSGEDLDSKRIVKGYNFVSKTTDATDDNGHGTHVAGTIAQTTNNGKGVAGIAPNAKIMPLKVLNKSGYGDITGIAEAIRWAADHGAHIINMSLGGGGKTQIMEDAIKYAQKKGVVVVAAAGNENRNRASYPAYYDGVVSVASYGPDGKRAFYSNYGDGVRISAPGGSDKAGKGDRGKILQETITGYQWYQGTSMASPHVAGVAALIRSAGVKKADDIIKILYESSKKVSSDDNNEFGAGKLNAKSAVMMAKGSSISSYPSETMSKKHRFVYIAGVIILLILFLIWYKKKKLMNKVYDLSFVPFILGIVLSTIGLVIPSMFTQNVFTSLLSSPIPRFDTILFGVRTPLFHSALIPIVFALFLSGGSNGLKSFIVSLSVGFASVLIVDSFILYSDIAFIPNILGTTIIDRVFLLLNALISMLLGMGVIKKAFVI